MKHAIAILILSASLAIADDKTFSSAADFRSIPGEDVMQHAADVDSDGHAVIRTKPGAGTTQAVSGSVSATVSSGSIAPAFSSSGIGTTNAGIDFTNTLASAACKALTVFNTVTNNPNLFWSSRAASRFLSAAGSR